MSASAVPCDDVSRAATYDADAAPHARRRARWVLGGASLVALGVVLTALRGGHAVAASEELASSAQHRHRNESSITEGRVQEGRDGAQP